MAGKQSVDARRGCNGVSYDMPRVRTASYQILLGRAIYHVMSSWACHIPQSSRPGVSCSVGTDKQNDNRARPAILRGRSGCDQCEVPIFSYNNSSNRNSDSHSNIYSTSISNSDKPTGSPHSYAGIINCIHGHDVTYTESMPRLQGVETYLGQTPGFAYARVVQLKLVSI